MTELCDLAFKYGTDKCPQILHTYTPFYFELLEPIRDTTKKVLEIGIGGARFREHAGLTEHPVGGSLRMWRDFFPNAQVYGIDYDPATMFKDDRITTLVCNTRKPEELDSVLGVTGTDVDVVIDDGSHRLRDQVSTFRHLLPQLKKGVVYIVEDVKADHMAELIASVPDGFRYSVPELQKLDHPVRDRRNHLVVIEHL